MDNTQLREDFAKLLESFGQSHPCPHESERTEENGLVRYTCTLCGFTMFMPASLDAQLQEMTGG